MALSIPAPTDQRAGVRPISFTLDNHGVIGPTVTLPIRPEDLSKGEPARVSVHQTLGRGVQGWVDDFGPGLPTLTLSGHTGWRHVQSLGRDGAESFEALNDLIVREYPRAKQASIDAGLNPAGVKLLFVDLLDNITWHVAPTQFVLRRSKSRPLLFQYQMQLQAISTSVDNPLMFLPDLGSIASGLTALDGAIAALTGLSSSVTGWVNRAVSFVDARLSPIGAVVSQFVNASGRVFSAVSGLVKTINNGTTSVANGLISLARNMAKVGHNVFATLAAVTSIPATLRASLVRVKRAFNEVLCIFSNSIRPRKTVAQFDGVYGASNCSSTTGGAPASQYADSNVFDLIQQSKDSGFSVSSGAVAGMARLSGFDPVLAPMSPAEMADRLRAVNAGVSP